MKTIELFIKDRHVFKRCGHLVCQKKEIKTQLKKLNINISQTCLNYTPLIFNIDLKKMKNKIEIPIYRTEKSKLGYTVNTESNNLFVKITDQDIIADSPYFDFI